MSQNFSFSSYHNTKLQLSDKNISKHTRVKFQILFKWIQNNSVFCCFSPLRAVQKGNQGAWQNHARISAYRVLQIFYLFNNFLYAYTRLQACCVLRNKRLDCIAQRNCGARFTNNCSPRLTFCCCMIRVQKTTQAMVRYYLGLEFSSYTRKIIFCFYI